MCPLRLKKIVNFSAVALLSVFLQACGGGGSGAASNGVTPTLSGTVTGFGSVVVDGVEVEDAYARVFHENANGSLSNGVLQMGQRVRVAHDGANQATQVLIDASVIGKVSAINAAANTLTVAGQSVLVNTDSTAGPLTVFGGGYSNLSGVALNDLVQVHGTPVYDAVSQGYQVKATRIQKDSGVTRVQINGKVAGYTTTNTGATLTINGLTVLTSGTTSVRPAGMALANGLQVTVYGNSLIASTLTATNIRVNRDQNSGNTSTMTQLSGVVSNYTTAGSTTTFEVQGSTVTVGLATIQPAGASIANNAYVMVKGSVASDGSITAAQIQVRTNDATTDLAKVLLIGVISDYVTDTSFSVRGVPVDASANTLTKGANCPAAFSAYTGVVKVQATQQSGTAVVKARGIECQPTASTQIIQPLEGSVAGIDSVAKTFSLTLSGGGAKTVAWTDATTFLGLIADRSLVNKSVHVEGYVDSHSTFFAKVVRLDDDSAQPLDDKPFRNPHQGGGMGAGWSDYRRSHP
ncbi:MAG: DUF5666 domain-containing protein [Alphaproteobacteria bacterium]|nr:DUF5666 domain-containing protein [Alphaproteobacteria bacterium]